jgi:hypothetical protein
MKGSTCKMFTISKDVLAVPLGFADVTASQPFVDNKLVRLSL